MPDLSRSPRPSVIMRVVLFLCDARQRQIETQIVREFEGNAAVFGGVCGGEKAAVFAVLHVFSIGFEHASLRPLRENFS